MDTALLIGMVLTITQVIKSWGILAKISPVIISVIISIGVVTYKAIETGRQFDAALLGILIAVILGANGAHKLIRG